MDNKEEYWWVDEKNKEIINFPISVINDNELWVATCNSETEKFLGKRLNSCAYGKTKEEAIDKMFETIRIIHEHSRENELNYQRFVPFRKGDWKHIGGKWLIIFGIQIYFRYGKNMKNGFYIPFTNLNVSFTNLWLTYKRYKNEKN